MKYSVDTDAKVIKISTPFTPADIYMVLNSIDGSDLADYVIEPMEKDPASFIGGAIFTPNTTPNDDSNKLPDWIPMPYVPVTPDWPVNTPYPYPWNPARPFAPYTLQVDGPGDTTIIYSVDVTDNSTDIA